MYFARSIALAACIAGLLLTPGCGSNSNDVAGFMHANINCSDLRTSQDFYGSLGFVKLMGGRSHASADFARVLDMPPYSLRYVQMWSAQGLLIDLIEWEDPFDPAPPHATPNALGIARLTLPTADLDCEIARLQNEGAEFLSEPTAAHTPSGLQRFVCFRDPDGAIIELVQEQTDAAGRPSVTVNCSNLDVSLPFYQDIGFSTIALIDEAGTGESAAGLNMASYQVRGALLALENGGPAVRLLEWEQPFDATPPYERLNHLGVARIALRSGDLDATVARLERLGVEFISEPMIPDGALSFLRVACLRDPDGTVLELVELFPRLGM